MQYNVLVTRKAADDLIRGEEYYEEQQEGLGELFWDSLISDINCLKTYAGIHRKQYGLFKTHATRFPYNIYYSVNKDTAWVLAVLPMKRDPAWIYKRLKS